MGKIIDLTGELVSTPSLRGGLAASGNGTSLDLRGYNGNIMALLTSEAGTGTTPTLDVKIQDSADNAAFADISPAKAFTQVVAVASHQEISVDPRAVRRYIRAVSTITGTGPNFDAACVFVGGKAVI